MKRMGFDIVLSSMLEYDENKGRVLGVIPRYLYTEKNDIDVLELEDIVKHSVGVTSSAIAYRDVLLSCGGFNESLRIGEDVDLWARCACRGFRIGLIKYPLAVRTIHGDQITASLPVTAIMKFLVHEFRYHKEYVEDLRNVLFAVARELSKRGVCDLARRLFKLFLFYSLSAEEGKLNMLIIKALYYYALCRYTKPIDDIIVSIKRYATQKSNK